MQTRNRTETVVHQLKAEEAALRLRLNQVCRAIADLQGPEADVRPQRRPCRAELLRQHLLDHPEGVRLKDVPAVLAAMGHVSFAANQTTNWLYQLPPEKAYFTSKDGIVTLRADFTPAAPSPATAFSADALLAKNSTGGQSHVTCASPADDAHPECAASPACQGGEQGATAIRGGNS